MPLVKAAWLRPGVHVTAVGSDGPGKQELEAACLASADLVVADRTSQCVRLGELQHAVAARVMTASDVYAELGELVAGRKSGRTASLQITIADLTGVGFQDTAIACAAFARLGAGG
jgi:ornithine cyclodeaminase